MMSTPQLTRRSAEPSPRFKTRISVVFYLFTILTAGIVFFLGGRVGFAVDVIAAVFYMAVTSVFYLLTKGA